MKTQEQELQDIDRKAAQAKEALAAKYRVLNLLGPIWGDFAPPNVHYGKLYGSAGSIYFRIQRFESIAEGKSPSLALLTNLLQHFKPVPLVQVKDGCTSFRPAGEWAGELLDVFPVTIRIELFQGAEATFEWYADLAGELWRFHVEFPLHMCDLGKLDLVYNRPFGHGEITSVERCDFHPNHGAQRIRWASGNHKTPNSFTLWWDIDSGKAVDFADLVQY